LREYYESEGADHPVRIEIPPGQYTPRFVFQHAWSPMCPSPGSQQGNPQMCPRCLRSRRRRWRQPARRH
jgi:hypothetical protein